MSTIAFGMCISVLTSVTFDIRVENTLFLNMGVVVLKLNDVRHEGKH